ncbi:MAG: hypothetical protein PHG25_02440 [Candidatus Pacebacteria bacterium]|nr:hypothetical protein [Candidatus Paceibacterota bacterium]
MKNGKGGQTDQDVSVVLARLRKIRARGQPEKLVVSTGLSKLRQARIITEDQYNGAMGITTKKRSL